MREHLGDLPVVSLDDLRAEMDADPTDDQGSVVQAGRERLIRRMSERWEIPALTEAHRVDVVLRA